jgi:hypothetical protein
MKIFNFEDEFRRRRAGKRPTAPPQPEADRVEARFALADAPRGGDTVLDRPRLLLAVAEFPARQTLMLDLVATASGRLTRLELAMTAPGASEAELADDIRRLATLTAPQALFKPIDTTANARLKWTPLAPRPEGAAAGVDRDGEPRTIWLAPTAIRAADFAAAVNAAEAAGVKRLRFELRSRHLSGQEREAVADAARRLALAEVATDDNAEQLTALSLWLARQSGVSVGVSVATKTSLHEKDLDCIAMALFGRPRARAADEPRQGLIVDLRASAPRGAAPAFRFAPTGDDLRRRVRRTQADVDAHRGAVVLGLDAADDPVRLGAVDRTHHFFIIGGTGTGKTTLIRHLLTQDMEAGEGVILIDPHGDLADAALKDAPKRRRKDIILVDPSDPACEARLDLLTTPGIDAEMERNFVVNQLIMLLSKQMHPGIPEAFGPVFENYFRNACFLLMLASKKDDRDLMKLQDVFADSDFRARLVAQCSDEGVRQFFLGIAGPARGDASIESVAPYITSKMTQFSGNPVTKRFLNPRTGQTLDLQSAMDKGKIVVVRLPVGLLGEYDARLLGALVLMQVGAAGMGRARIPEAKRRPVRVYVDEFQHLATRTAADMLAQSRKYGFSLTLANQSLSQLDGGVHGADVARAVLANCGTIAAFRTGVNDAAVLANYLAPDVGIDELLTLGVGDFVARRLVRGAPQPAQRLHGLPPPETLE